MPTAIIDGIATRYQVVGSGPPLLLFAPGGFDAAIEQWTTLGVYARTRLLERLSGRYQCILFDRRECGESGGRLERVSWTHFAAQGKGLLDYLKIERAHLLGGCMGCGPVLAFAVAYPDAARSMILFWPVGGAKYRISSQQRFAEHLAYVQQYGLEAVVNLVLQEGKPFNKDPRGGPWASVIRRDRGFAESFAKQNVDEYKLLIAGAARTLFDRDTAPGSEPEDLLRLGIPALIVPGHDPSHATSAARYLEECLPRSEYWDVPVAAQTAESAPSRILQFLDLLQDPAR
ncbi:MAG TPA: alpha/beta hydrolase [Bryobacteraceae bacterium]|nr:alpha/beta hydrolase [Bryobacteraceae bacterium]